MKRTLGNVLLIAITACTVDVTVLKAAAAADLMVLPGAAPVVYAVHNDVDGPTARSMSMNA